MKGFARGLALKKRHKTIRKWPILCVLHFLSFSRFYVLELELIEAVEALF